MNFKSIKIEIINLKMKNFLINHLKEIYLVNLKQEQSFA